MSCELTPDSKRSPAYNAHAASKRPNTKLLFKGSFNKVGTHEGTSRRDRSQGPVPGTNSHRVNRPIFVKNPVAGTEFWSPKSVPRIQTGLNSWDRFRGPKFSPCDRIFDKNWPVHTMGLGRRDCSLRPVPATSPLVCGDL